MIPALFPALRTVFCAFHGITAPDVALILTKPYAGCPPTFWNEPPAKTAEPSVDLASAHTV